ncbi:MAG: hypothetical protein P1U74_00340 [Legionellaceae bacterium]|nr:hypothetical protein [Legionellaceae bacterium]
MESRFSYNSFFYNDYDIDGSGYNETNKDNLTPEQIAAYQKNYVESESIFKTVEANEKLFNRIIKDISFQDHSDEVRALIKKEYEKSLRLLIVNTSSSNRRLDIKKYKDALDASSGMAAANEAAYSEQKNKDYWEKTTAFFAKLYTSFNNLIEFHPSQFFDFLGTLNLYRLSYVFSRLSWKNLWLFFKSLNFLDINDKLRGHFINIAMMDYPTTVFNLASVFIFVARLLVEAATILKHWIKPTVAEQGFSWSSRIYIEWVRKYARILNDIVWAVINAVTNFPLHFGIAIPVASWILAGFLFFDIGLLSYQLYGEESDYKERKAWAEDQKSIMNGKKLDFSHDEEYAQKVLAKNKPIYSFMLDLLDKEAQICLAETRAIVGLCIFATVLFVASLACCITMSSPLVLPICFFVCVFSVAMIISRGKFGEIFSARKTKELDTSGKYKDERNEAIQKAQWDFAKSFAINLFAPMIIIGLFTVHWPTAIAAIVVYLAVMNINFTNDKKDVKNIKADVLTKSANHDDDALITVHEEELPSSCCIC